MAYWNPPRAMSCWDYNGTRCGCVWKNLYVLPCKRKLCFQVFNVNHHKGDFFLSHCLTSNLPFQARLILHISVLEKTGFSGFESMLCSLTVEYTRWPRAELCEVQRHRDPRRPVCHSVILSPEVVMVLGSCFCRL